MNTPSDLLLGRKTFEMWAKFWPQHNDVWPAVNTAQERQDKGVPLVPAVIEELHDISTRTGIPFD